MFWEAMELPDMVEKEPGCCKGTVRRLCQNVLELIVRELS